MKFFIPRFPEINASLDVKPISSKIIKVHAKINFKYDWKGSSQVRKSYLKYWAWVESADDNMIHYFDSFILARENVAVKVPIELDFHLPIFEDGTNNLFFKVTSDNLVNCGYVCNIDVQDLLFPEIFNSNTEVLNLDPLSTRALHHQQFEAMFPFK